MSEFIIKEEVFRLGIFDKVPEPLAGECFLLYQAGAGMRNSMVISHGSRYSSTEVRHRHYNKKVNISLQEKMVSQNYQVAMKNRDFHFNTAVKIRYYVQDVQEYFFEGQAEADDIQRVIREVVRSQDGKWDVSESIDMRNDLEDKIEQKMRRFAGIKIRTPEVNVVPDEAAVKILDSNRDRTVEIHLSRNRADKEIASNEQAGRIADSKKEIKGKQIEDLATMVQNFGSMAPIMEEYFKGNLDGTQLYGYIEKAKSDNMAILNEAVKRDMLSDKDILERLNDILCGNGIIQSDKYQQIADHSEDVNRLEMKDEGTDEEERLSPADGDFI